MASSPCGTSSGCSLLLQNYSGSEENLQTALMNQKKQKRMISNRESARRSRMRKQKRLDDLSAQANQLRNQNSQILTHLTLTTKNYFCVEAENSVLRTQMMELSSRLQSLNEILRRLNGNPRNGFFFDGHHENQDGDHIGLIASSHCNFICTMSQPIMAPADNMLRY